MKKRKGKSLISLFICFSMIVTMIPSAVWAESTVKKDSATNSDINVTEEKQTEVEKKQHNLSTNSALNEETNREEKNKADKVPSVENEKNQQANNMNRPVEKPSVYDSQANMTSKAVKKINTKELGYTVNAKTTTNLNVRTRATSSSNKLGVIKNGTKIVIKGFVKNSDSTWYETTYKGKKGYVSGKYVNVNSYTYKNRVGRSVGEVFLYVVSGTNTIYKSLEIPKDKNIKVISRISTNKGDRYKIEYNGKTGYTKGLNLNVDPIEYVFKMPMTLKFRLLDSANAYQGTTSNGKVQYRIPKNDTVYITEKIKRQSYSWYKVKHNNKIVYCRTKDIDIVKLKYKDRIGITKSAISTYVESEGKAVKNNTIPKGKQFKLLGRIYTTTDKSIYKVSYNGIAGYILNKNVDLNPIMEQFQYEDKIKVKLKKETKLYKSTTTSYNVLYTVPSGTYLKFSEKIYRDLESWYKTTYNGKTVYCKTKDVDIRKEIIKNIQRNTTGSFYLYKEVSNKSKRLITVPKQKVVKLLSRVETENRVYLQIEYNGTVGYAVESFVNQYLKDDYVVSSRNFGLAVKGETTNSTSFYADASKESKKVYSVKKGTDFNTLSELKMNSGSKWYKISYKDQTLYVPAADAKIFKIVYKKITRGYNQKGVNLRSGLGTNTEVKTYIPAKSIIEIKERYNTVSGYWYKVEYNGYTGYASGASSYVSIKDVGIDISKYNTDIDWKKVKDSGIDFVFIRVGYTGYGNGVQVEDPYFQQHIKGAISAGLDIGVYFFTQAINVREAKKEVDFAANVIEPYKKYINLPLVVDSEFIDGSRPGRADHLSKTDRTNILDAFCQRVEYRGYKPMIYMSKSWITGQLYYDKIKQYPIWVAQYNIQNTTPQPYKYWQYTSGGTVPGIRGRVDMNIKI